MQKSPQSRNLYWKTTFEGTQMYYSPEHTGKWLTTWAECPKCRQVWQVVVPIGYNGAECPYCGCLDETQIWGIYTAYGLPSVGHIGDDA